MTPGTRLASHHGITLVGLIVALSLFAIISYFIGLTFNGLTRSQQQLVDQTLSDNLRVQVTTLLSNPSFCTENFKNKILKTNTQSVQTGSSFSKESFGLFQPNTSGNPVILAKADMKLGNRLISSLQINLEGKSSNLFFATLTINQLEIREQKSFQKPSLTFPVKFLTQPSGNADEATILSCAYNQ